MMQRNLMGIVVAFGLCWLEYFFMDVAQAQEIESTTKEDNSRIRVALTGYQMTIDKNRVLGSGIEFSLDRALSLRWLASGSLGQAYQYDKTLKTGFTSIDIALWYSVFGHFKNDTLIWSLEGRKFASFQEDKSWGLRLGIGTQQYYINTPSGVIPFSGLAGKVCLELGLESLPFDLALGGEIGRLVGSSYSASLGKGFLTMIFSLSE